LPYLIVKSLQSRKEYIFKLPVGMKGIENMSLLRDQNLLAFTSTETGYFYILDVSFATSTVCIGNQRPQVKLNIRIPHEEVRTFDIDCNMQQVILGTAQGNVYIYELPKAIENENVLSRRRLEMGVEEDLVYTFLDRVHPNEFQEYLKTTPLIQPSYNIATATLLSESSTLIPPGSHMISLSQPYLNDQAMETI
jgi:hypothetical protein